MYDRTLKPMKSTIKEYRELSLNIDNKTVKREWASDEVRDREDILLGL
jgi:hypothetical protein